MGYIFDFKETNQYTAWCQKGARQYDFQLQAGIMMQMLSPLPGRSILDIGCGAGRCFPPLLDHALQVTGVDPSPYMLDIAAATFGHRVTLHRAHAEDLPFEDNAFHYSILMTSLEFMERPSRTIEEACRVTRDKIFIGVYNKYAPANLHRRLRAITGDNPLSHARFFGIWELKKIIRDIIGPVPVSWRTTLQLPFMRCKAWAYLEKRTLVQKSPWGTMIGMAITPIPRFRTRPLCLHIYRHPSCSPLSGLAREVHPEAHENTFL